MIIARRAISPRGPGVNKSSVPGNFLTMVCDISPMTADVGNGPP
jgi:hypothetical protein